MSDASGSDLVRKALLAQNREDDEAFLAALHPDVVWEARANPFGFPAQLHGREEVLRAAHEGRRRAGHLKAIMHEIEEDGDEVLVIGVLATDQVSMPRAWIWTLQDGLVTRIQSFSEHLEARQVWRASHGSR